MFMALAVGAQRHGTPAPSLLPDVKVDDEQVTFAA